MTEVQLNYFDQIFQAILKIILCNFSQGLHSNHDSYSMFRERYSENVKFVRLRKTKENKAIDAKKLGDHKLQNSTAVLYKFTRLKLVHLFLKKKNNLK